MKTKLFFLSLAALVSSAHILSNTYEQDQLIEAITNNDMPMVQALLKRGAATVNDVVRYTAPYNPTLEEVMSYQTTPLLLALSLSACEQRDLAIMLLKNYKINLDLSFETMPMEERYQRAEESCLVNVKDELKEYEKNAQDNWVDRHFSAALHYALHNNPTCRRSCR